MGDVFLDAVVQVLLVRPEFDPLVLGIPSRNPLRQDAAFAVAVQQVAPVSPHERSDRRVMADHFAEDGSRRRFERPNVALGLDRVGQASHGLPGHRPQLAACRLGKGRIDAISSLEVVLGHAKKERPVALAERTAYLLEEAEKVVLACSPEPFEAQKLEQIPDLDRVHLHGRGGQQVEAAGAILQARAPAVSTEELQQVIGPAGPDSELLPACMVGLVDEDEIPLRLQHFVPAVGSLGELAGGDQVVDPTPWGTGEPTLGAVHIDECAAFIAGNVERALLPELLLPLPYDAGGCEDERAADPPCDDELTERQPGLDRLAEPHLVAEEEAAREAFDHGVDHAVLVGPRGDRAGLDSDSGGLWQERSVPQEAERRALVRRWLSLQRLDRRRLARSMLQEAVADGLRERERDPLGVAGLPEGSKAPLYGGDIVASGRSRIGTDMVGATSRTRGRSHSSPASPAGSRCYCR